MARSRRPRSIFSRHLRRAGISTRRGSRRNLSPGVESLEARRLFATLYWDPDGIPGNNVVATGAGLGGSGTWADGGAAVWFNPALNRGAGGYVAWNSGRGDTAVFTGPSGGRVTIAGSVGAAGIEFRGLGYVVQGGGFATAAGGSTFTATAAASFNAAISGSGSLTKNGAGTLTLGAASHSYTGDTIVTAGTLNVLGNLESHVRKLGGDIQGVMFYDPQVAAAVREGLGFDTATVLTQGVLSQSPPLTTLTLDGNRVSDLTGLANLDALTSLALVPGDHALRPDGLPSLAPLVGLRKLSSLTLQHVGLTDAVLGTLPALPGLTTLDVRFNSLVTLPSAVANQPGLSRILVHGNPALTASPRAGLLALKGRPVDVDVAADRPEAATTVADLAAALYFLPIKMLEYVTNTVAYQPYVGAMKGALATLQTKAGNDWDTNSLLAGLFNAAGISTRYVAGTIEITVDQLKDYVGARDANAAAMILDKAGLRYNGFGNHLRHTWIEASVRLPGAMVAGWVPLDASWKVRDFGQGLSGMLSTVSFSPLESDYLTNPGWWKKTTADYYEAKVGAWLAANRPDLTIADVAYDGPIRQQSFTALPGSLPYAVLSQPAETARPAAIPVIANHSVSISIANGTTTLFSRTLSIPEIALKRLTIDPGLNAAGTLAQPTLRIDGAVTATSATTVPATARLQLTISVAAPRGGQGYSRTFTRTADRFIAIGLDANQFSEPLLVAKRATANAEQLNAANGVAVDRERAVGGLLDLAISSYFNATDADEASIAGLTGAIADRTRVALGIATGGPALPATPTPGLQFPFLPADVGIDVPANVSGGFAIDASSPAIDLTRDLLMGYGSSALEGLILEELTNFESVSTVKAFQLVAASGGLSSLVEINAGNVGRIATLLPGVRPEIRDAIAANVRNGIAGAADYAGVTFKALVPKTEVSVGDTTPDKQWKGVGYTLTCVTTNPADPRSGKTVGYIINGSVGSGPLISYGGAVSRHGIPAPVLRPAVSVNDAANYVGDPVNIANGNVYHDETDLEIPNVGVPLAFRRHYDSIHTVSGLVGSPAAWSDRGMGEGWSFTYSDRIEAAADGSVTWFNDRGLRLDFKLDLRRWHPPMAWNSALMGFVNPDGLAGKLSGTAADGYSWTDADGKITTFGRTVNGISLLVSVTDRFGNGIRIDRVAGTNRLAKVSDNKDANRWLSFAYNSDNPARISGVTDFTGRTWSYSYAGGRLATVTAPVPAAGIAAPVVRYSYHADKARQGLLASVFDPLGNATSWEYYANRRGFRVTDAEGNRHSLTYNLHRRQSAFIDERGNVSLYSYDSVGNQLERRRPDRTVERATWSGEGLKLSSTDAYGATEKYAYDSARRPASITDRLGNVTTFNYASATLADINTITAFNKVGDATDDVVTRFVYDATGFRTSRIDDAGTGRLNLETRFTVSAGGRGLVGSQISPLGYVTSFTYNQAGQVLSRSADSAPGAAVIERAAYDLRGNVVSKTDGNGNATGFVYDTLGRKTAETAPDPDGTGPLPAIVTTYQYDAAGNQTATVVGDGRTTRDAFDRMQRIVRTVRPDGTIVVTSYDPAGNIATQADAAGRITRFDYDARNRQVAVVFPDGTTERTRYDGGDRVVAATNRAGSVTAFTYDTLSRKLTETGPAAAAGGSAPVTRYAYDSRGNLASVTGPLGARPGDPAQSTSYEYDNLGRKTKEAQADPDGTGPLARPSKTFTYDKNGNLRTINDPRGFTTTYGYDQLGRRTSATTPDPDGTGPLLPLTTQYVYDKSGNLRFEIAPGGTNENDVAFATEHVYDALGRTIRTLLPDPDGAAGPQSRPLATRVYNAGGFLASTTDPLGRTTSYAYDRLGRTVAITDPLGGVATTVYDAVGNAVITTDPLGRRTFTTFDAMDRKLSVQSPRPDATSAPPVMTFRYDAVGNLASTTDPLGRTTWRQYDALGRMTGATGALGVAAGDPQHTTKTEYDLAGRVTAVTDPLGRRTDYAYDNLGRKIREIGPDVGQGRPTTHYGYDAAGNLRYVTDPRGAAAGDSGFTTWTFYDGLNRRTAVVDALGADWLVTAIPETLPGTVTANVLVTTYDRFGRLAAVADKLGRQTSYAYDNLGRKISETAPAADASTPRPVTRYAYDLVGNLTAVTDPLGFVTTYAYDPLDRRTRITDARGFSTVTTYDVAGNTLSLTDASGNVTRYAYDRLNRLGRETDPSGNSATFAYDLAGNRILETDRNGRVTSFIYDAANRRVVERWQQTAAAAVSHTINRIYDAAGQLLGVTETDAVNPVATTAWEFSYDARGNVVKSRMAPGEIAQQQTTWSGALAAGDATIEWDGDGRPERADAIAAFSVAPGDVIDIVVTASGFTPAVLLFQSSKPGTVVWYEGPAGSGRCTARRVADAADTWSFAASARDENAAGSYAIQIVRNGNAIVTAALVEYDFTYDKAGNLTGTREDQAAVADMYGFGKAASGLVVQTSFAIDALDRVTRYEQALPGGVVVKRADYTYRADDSVSAVKRYAGAGSNPVAGTSNQYDGIGRLTGIAHASAGSGLISYGFTYDAASRMTSLTSPEGKSSFTLDSTDQLLSASLTGERYAYDATGNRTTAGTLTGPGNRVLVDGVYRYAYDAEGNRTAKYIDKDGSKTLSAGDTDVTVYGWDQRNRLVAVSHLGTWAANAAAAVSSQVTAALPGSDLELRYTYDAFDRRIRRAIDADGSGRASGWDVSYAAYAGDVRTLEIAQGSTVRDQAGKVVGIVGSVVQRNFYGSGVDTVLAVDQVAGNATKTFWMLGDHQGSIRDIVSGTGPTLGRLVEHRQYDSFGRVIRRTASAVAGAAATAGVGIDFGYAGRPLEERTGLSDNRARWYEPGTGRFINEDPSGFKGGDANLFRYVGNDPLDRTDPSGLAAKWAQQAAKSAVPAAGFAGLGQNYATTTSAATTSQIKASTATPSMSLAATNAASVAKPSSAKPLPFASLVTTGRAASYAPLQKQNRWTATDREAALRSDMAYFFNEGGLLNDLKVGYGSQGVKNEFTETGLSAMLSRSPVTGKYFLAFRGTESLLNGKDVAADIMQGAGLRTAQYEQAIRLAQLVKDKLGPDAKIVLTGHSLGGGMAAAASYATGLDAVVFNPASVNRIYANGNPGEIRSHVIAGDILSLGRTAVGRTAPGEIIVHPPRSAMPLNQHSMFNFPDY